MKKMIPLALLLSTKLLANIGTAGFHEFAYNRVFVETGTFGGYGIDKAVAAGFSQILTIDIDPGHIEYKKLRNKNNQVKFFVGDSSVKLWEMIKDIDEPITFWLDAHRFPPEEAGLNCPLLAELHQIRKHPIKTHTILIDDMSYCGTIAFDGLTKFDLIREILTINPNYQFRFLPGGDDDEVPNNILVAYIEPSN